MRLKNSKKTFLFSQTVKTIVGMLKKLFRATYVGYSHITLNRINVPEDTTSTRKIHSNKYPREKCL